MFHSDTVLYNANRLNEKKTFIFLQSTKWPETRSHICCLNAKHAVLMNQEDVSDWSDTSICELSIHS